MKSSKGYFVLKTGLKTWLKRFLIYKYKSDSDFYGEFNEYAFEASQLVYCKLLIIKTDRKTLTKGKF